ncbi:MAG: hypothetical protein GEV09_20415 [Pseudonocardiaceae bacterium]|nr:hypothetical protein [Pseudonocardiaceae bacterium]
MRTLHEIRRFLERIPRGFLADGRTLSPGLASALDAQRARHAGPTMVEVMPHRREHRDDPFVPAGG